MYLLDDMQFGNHMRKARYLHCFSENSIWIYSNLHHFLFSLVYNAYTNSCVFPLILNALH